MKCKNKITRVFVLLIFSASLSGNLFAKDALDSAQIKKVRHLSQALLKSRLLEKQRLDEELKPIRQQIDLMQSALNPLVSLNPDKNTSIVARSIINEGVLQKNDLLPSSVGALDVKEKPQSNAKNNVVSLVTRQQKAVSSAVIKISNVRKELENDIPKKWQLWKKETASDHYKRQVMSVARNVEKAMESMEQSGQMDIEKIKSLKQKLVLRRHDGTLSKVEPTFRTVTKFSK